MPGGHASSVTAQVCPVAWCSRPGGGSALGPRRVHQPLHLRGGPLLLLAFAALGLDGLARLLRGVIVVGRLVGHGSAPSSTAGKLLSTSGCSTAPGCPARPLHLRRNSERRRSVRHRPTGPRPCRTASRGQ